MPLDRLSKIILWAFIAFNLVIAATLLLTPEQIDAQYRGGPMTPTREFQWFSVASFHLFMIAVTAVSLATPEPRSRRRLHLASSAFYLWDAATQWLYWGAYIGVEAKTLHTNAGISAGIGLMLLVVWWRDRPPSADR